MLTLTFDDGPDPVWTPRVLDRLRGAGVLATFFVLGERVRAAPQVLEQIVRHGHVVGLHGDAHLDHTVASADELEADTARALNTLQEAGVNPAWWRLPWGRHGDHTAVLASRYSLRIAGWDVDTHDWRGDGWADQPAENLAVVERTGGVVLLHDAIGPGATRADCANTLDLVDGLLEQARRAQLTVGPLGGGANA